MSEPRRTLLEETHDFEVVVIGGGVAGVCAALACARQRAKTALVHNRPVLGGNSSTEVRVPISGAGSHNALAAETGIVHELILEERTRNYDRVGNSLVNASWDIVLYDACRREPTLSLFLNTNVHQTLTQDSRVAEVVGIQSGTEKRLRFRAEYFVDATGDGTVGMEAGVPYRIGQEARSEYGESLAPEEAWAHTEGNSLMFRAVDAGRAVDFTPPEWAVKYESEDAFRYRPHQPPRAGYWWIEIGWPYDTIADNETLRDELLPHVLGVWDHIKNHCKDRDKMRNWALDWVGMVPGKRESRRFIGAHVMTQTEVQNRELYPDRIGYGGWIIDDHLKEGIRALDKKPSFDDSPQSVWLVAPFSVTLRSLYANEVPNLLFAGRDMSASRLVFNSLRVQATLGVIGQATGVAAARCVQRTLDPGQLTPGDVDSIQQTLLREDAYIPHLPNHDPDDLARGATVTASSEAGLPQGVSDEAVSVAQSTAQLAPLGRRTVTSVGAFLENTTNADVELHAKLVRAFDVWDVAALDKGEAAAEATATLAAKAEGWVDFEFDSDFDAPALCWLVIDAAKGIAWRLADPSAPGLCAARQNEYRWWFSPQMFGVWKTLSLCVKPTASPYSAMNVTNGVGRPECWPNLWMSDPTQPLPQWLDLAFDEPIEVNEIHIAFDTNVNRTLFQMPGLFRSPECAADYSVRVEADSGMESVVEVSGNYQRRRVHAFEPHTTKRVRLQINATNGAAEARVFEVRLYAR